MVKRRGGHNEKEQNRNSSDFHFLCSHYHRRAGDCCQNRGCRYESGVTYTIGYLPITHALPVFEEKELLELENADV